MVKENFRAFLLKIGDSSDPVSYMTVAGLRTTQMDVKSDYGRFIKFPHPEIEVSKSIPGGRVQYISITGAGVFVSSDAALKIKDYAMGGIIDCYELSFECGERIRGKFLVSRLEDFGSYNGERSYKISLESTEPVSIV